MSPSPQLAPPGSSSYSSGTAYVGDGTWDSSRNTFLLPNLVGLNFDTMRYNGMGNRFRELPGYSNLIRAHGIIAAITFLLIVPSAILIIRFYTRRPRWAVRYHVWLQILTLLLTTVIFVLGWLAVGNPRKLTNPHHGIGLAIYVLVLVQAFGGWWVHRSERKKRRVYEPLKVMLHHWFGRTIAFLGLAQIPLGLTLYGSPVALFVLYALAVFALLVIYFILTHLRERHGGSDYDSRYDYDTESVGTDRRRRSGSGNIWQWALGGVGVFALVDWFQSRRSKGQTGNPSVVGSRRHSGSYVEDEKYSQYGHEPDREDIWEDRLLKIAAPVGLAGLVTRYFDRRYQDRDSDISEYGPPLGGATPINDRRDGNRPPPGGPINDPRYNANRPPGAPIPPGGHFPSDGHVPPGGHAPQGGPIFPNQPLPSSQHPLNQRPPNRPHRPPSLDLDTEYASASGERRGGHGLRDGLATLGVMGLLKSAFNRRKTQKNDQYQDQYDGQHFTGDDRPPRHQHRPGMTSISSDTSLTNDHHHNNDNSNTGVFIPAEQSNAPFIPAGAYPGGTTGPAAMTEQERERERRRQEALPLGGVLRPVSMPPIPPDPGGGFFHRDSSGSESYVSASGRDRHRHHPARDATAAGTAGGAAGLVAGEASSNRPPNNRHERVHSASGGEDTHASTPVSVKVKMHKDGRQVTLRRLPEAEAAAEREARRSSHRRRADSVSSLSSPDTGGERFRRNQMQDRQEAEAMRIESERLAAARNQASSQSQTRTYNQGQGQSQGGSNVPHPQPPPIPESSAMGAGGTGSVGSPGTYVEGMSGTEASTDYANNRRRRRAERAQAKLAREARGGGGKTVGFE